MPKQRGAVGRVPHDRLVSVSTDEAIGVAKRLELLGYELGVFVGGGKMRHQTRDANGRIASELGEKRGEFGDRHTEPAHAGVHFEMNVDRTARGHGRERRRLGDLVENRSESRSNHFAMGSAVNPVEHEDCAIDPGLSEFEPFFGERHAEPVDPACLKGLRHRDDAMAVPVGFDDRQDLLAGRCFSNDLEVVRDRIEEDLGARRPQRFVGAVEAGPKWSWRCWLHRLSVLGTRNRVKDWRPHAGRLGSGRMSRAERHPPDTMEGPEQRSSRLLWGGLLLAGLVAMGLMLARGRSPEPDEVVTPVAVELSASGGIESAAEPTTTRLQQADRQPPRDVEQLRTRVLRRYPHDRDAFTQGLLWHDGFLYESTGQRGESSLRKVRLDDGRVVKQQRIDDALFGEGLARVGDRLVQLTWQAELAIVADLETLKQKSTLSYEGEGWGLCFDGSSLVMSDGSSTLTFRDPETLRVVSRVNVRRGKRPERWLNELECVGSNIYANIWRRNEIVRIDAASGEVTAVVDASGLLTPEQARKADVLNGIAFRPETETFLITGKLWPTMFEVAFTAP